MEKAQIDKNKYMRRENGIRQEIENISHDLRTPLTSILGYLELINDKDLSEKEKKEYLSIIERRANELNIFSNNTEGVSEEEFQCLFNRFYMKNTSRNNSSSGLGLTVTKLLIEEMGGEIKAEIEERGEEVKAEIKENWIRFTMIYPVS